MTQARAVKTRADLLAGAATEFARYGYAASSVVRILNNTACTKGAMYFHFASKREMADAVLDTAAAVYTTLAQRWTTEDGIDPLDAIKGIVDDAAQAFTGDVSLRAEARLSVEPEFSARRPTAALEAAVLALANTAAKSGCLREGFTAEKFVRVLAAPMAGHRLLAHIVPTGVDVSVRSGYHESLETVLTAARQSKPESLFQPDSSWLTNTSTRQRTSSTEDSDPTTRGDGYENWVASSSNEPDRSEPLGLA